jgi:hypothetical protein
MTSFVGAMLPAARGLTVQCSEVLCASVLVKSGLENRD